MKETIVWLFSGPIDRVSFGRVIAGLGKYLVKHFDIYCLSGEHKGLPIDVNGIVTYSLKSTKDIKQSLKKLEPNIVILLGPSLFFEIYHKPYKQFVSNELKNVKQLAYVIIDLPPLEYFRDWLSGFDGIITPSEYSREFLVKQGIECEVVPHGVDLDIFKPQDKPDDVFRFGTVSENMTRKNLPALLEATTILKADKDGRDFKTMMFTNPHKIYPLPKIARSLKLTYTGDNRDIEFSQDIMRNMGVPSSQMGNIYNSFHVQVIPSGGECFGLGYLEASACGIPTITSIMGAGKEILGESGIYVPTVGHLLINEGVFNLISIKGLASAMLALKEDDALRKRLGDKAIQVAQEYSWDKVATLFKSKLDGVLGK